MSKPPPRSVKTVKELVKRTCEKKKDMWEKVLNLSRNVRAYPPLRFDNEHDGIIESSQVNSNEQPLKVQISDKILYYPERKLFSGEFSDVYIGCKEVPTCEVAIKRLRKGPVEDPKSKELEILRNVKHPNLVSYFFAEKSGEDYFLVMELANFTLESWLPQHTDPELRVKICKDVATGVRELHKRNIIHRDIKPSNVLIFEDKISGSQPVAKICDFGISRIMNQNTNRCQTTSNMGTIGFMPPESQPEMNLTPSFDIFSLGIKLALIMTGGKHIFSWNGNTDKFHIQSKIQKGKPNWALLKDRKHTALKNLLQVMLASDPLERSSMEIILEHPFFWTTEESFKFLLKVSGDIKNGGKCNSAISREAQKFLPRLNWKIRLHQKIQTWIQKNDHELAIKSNRVPFGWRVYSEFSIVQLMNFIRDQQAHYSNWDSTDLKSEEIFGTDGSNYELYFIKTFLELPTFLYVVLQDKKLQGIGTSSYYRNNLNCTFTLKR